MSAFFNLKKGVILLMSISLITLVSCKKEGCTDAKAENYDVKAKEDNSTCTYARDKFLATYDVTESCSSGNYSYSITIGKSSNGVELIIINNFGDFGVDVVATVNGDKFSFNETIQGTNFTGSGTLNGSSLIINYVASESGFTDTCTKNCIKK